LWLPPWTWKDGLHECISQFPPVQPLSRLWTTFLVFIFIFGEWQLPLATWSRRGCCTNPGVGQASQLGPVGLGSPWPSSVAPSSWRPILTFCIFPKYLRHFGTISSSDKIGGLPTWTLIFTFRSSKMFRCSTLVLASFGSDFVLHLNMNGTFLLLVWTWCVFVLFVCVFLQKHYTPKCTHKVELVILLACLVVG
jgi:hypothetical protein